MAKSSQGEWAPEALGFMHCNYGQMPAYFDISSCDIGPGHLFFSLSFKVIFFSVINFFKKWGGLNSHGILRDVDII